MFKEKWKEITIVLLSVAFLITALLPIARNAFTENRSGRLSVLAGSYGYGGGQCERYSDMAMEILTMLNVYSRGFNVDSFNSENIYAGRQDQIGGSSGNLANLEPKNEFGSLDLTLGTEQADQALVNMVNEVDRMINLWIECRQSEFD